MNLGKHLTAVAGSAETTPMLMVMVMVKTNAVSDTALAFRRRT